MVTTHYYLHIQTWICSTQGCTVSYSWLLAKISWVTTMLGNLNWRALDQRRIDSRLVIMYIVTYDLVEIPAYAYLIPNRRESKFTHPLACKQIPTSTNYYKSPDSVLSFKYINTLFALYELIQPLCLSLFQLTLFSTWYAKFSPKVLFWWKIDRKIFKKIKWVVRGHFDFRAFLTVGSESPCRAELADPHNLFIKIIICGDFSKINII